MKEKIKMMQLTHNDLNERLLNLFNVVLSTPKLTSKSNTVYNMELGYALVGQFDAKLESLVSTTVSNSTLSDSDLTKTFYKLWNDITNKSRGELFVDQICHYLTTYGGLTPGFMYIPNDQFDIELPKNVDRVPVRVITTVSKEKAIDRIVSYLNSGIALEQSTMVSLINLLSALQYDFKEAFRNKEANIITIEVTGRIPEAAEEYLRYILFKVTESTLLIKNQATVLALKSSRVNFKELLEAYIKQHSEVKLAEIFNRFKPLFLAIKRADNKRIINSISKLSKKAHTPLVQSVLNYATSKTIKNSDLHWLENATTFALLRALNSIVLAEHGPTNQNYRIRNGKMFTKISNVTYNPSILTINKSIIIAELKSRVDGTNKTVYIPENIDYGLPTSEKSFVGNLPALTKFSGESLNVGMYWENQYGANDLDLSSMSMDGTKVGWNSHYDSGNVTYSGDITNAPNGATEYLRFVKGCGSHIVYLNVYSGDNESDYDLIVAKTNSKVSSEAVMKPENLITSQRKKTRNRQSILGFVHAEDSCVEFVVTDFDAGIHAVSSDNNDLSEITLKSLLFKNKYSLRLDEMLNILGYNIVYDKNDTNVNIDLSVENLSKDSIMSLFK